MSSRKDRKPLPYSQSPYSTQRDQGSPTKASTLLQQDHADYISSLASRKQNFCTCLELYQVSHANDLPQKCLIHNNFITLYCENEFKLLCVNCIYGSAVHKDHRVVPSKNSLPNIARDNEDNLRVLEEELDRLKYADAEMKKNKKTLDDEYRSLMAQIDAEFKDIYALIEHLHELTRSQVNEAFQRASSLTDTGLKETHWWKELLIKTRQTFPKPSLNEHHEIYKHLVLDLFMQEKFDEEKLTYMPSTHSLRDEYLRNLVELRELLEERVGSSRPQTKSRNRPYDR